MKLLITGGAGYIGSHTIVELLQKGYEVVIVDNLKNSSAESLKRVARITGQTVPLHQLDLRDAAKLDQLFSEIQCDAVIHFAGLKAVGESVSQPLDYYDNNLLSTINLCRSMDTHNVRKLIFSSSATVYGETTTIPYTEDLPLSPTNPYGWTKAMNEQILRDVANTGKGWQISLLRYFNPIGAHSSGLIGEDPRGVPNNLLPYIAQVAIGKRERLNIFGNDYATADGTCERDYIHVTDLALGHIAALEHLPAANSCAVYNLGSGQPTSVLEMVKAFAAASGQTIPYEFAPRRAGDLPAYYADATKAAQELGWQTTRSIEQACADTWKWQSQNPNGLAG